MEISPFFSWELDINRVLNNNNKRLGYVTCIQ